MKKISNCTIVTVDPTQRIIENGVLVIDRDRIAWVGKEHSMPGKFRKAKNINAAGKIVFPGFVNIHTHVTLSIMRGVADDLGLAPSYSPKVPQWRNFSARDCYIFSLLGGMEALRFGTTCIVDNYLHAHESAKAFSELGLRAVVSERLHDASLTKVPQGIYEFDMSKGEELLTRGIDLIDHWNGIPNSRVRACLGPHAPDTCSPGYLRAVREEAENNDVGLVIHLAQSKREGEVILDRSGLSPTAYLADIGILGNDLIAGHCIYVDDKDIKLLRESEAHVSHQSGSNSKGGMMAPIRKMYERGINIGLGTDNMSSDMIMVMRLAVCVARMLEENKTALKAYDVLKMATFNGAKALGLEDDIGSIKVGKKADLIIADYSRPHMVPIIDPVSNLVHNGLGNDIDTVIIDGDILVENGKITTVDENNILEEAQKRAETHWDKV